MNNFPQYEVEVEEVHHTQKLDAPSGTAISLAKDIIGELDRKNRWQLEGQDNPEALKIKAIRRDPVPGLHTIKYDCNVDYIEITHNAKSEKFVMGLVGALLTGAALIALVSVLSYAKIYVFPFDFTKTLTLAI